LALDLFIFPKKKTILNIMIEEVQVSKINNKTRNLILGLLFDAIGMVSFAVPFIGEFSDVIWAPLAGFLMTWMYKGTIGRVGGVIAFLEEVLPFSDVIPTFTLTWIYNYLIKSKTPNNRLHPKVWTNL
jgi:hypothetical protein